MLFVLLFLFLFFFYRLCIYALFMFFVISSFLLRLRGYDETYLSIFLAAIAVIAMWLSFFFISYVNMKVHYISKKLVHPGHLELGHTVNFVYYFFFRFFLIHRVCFVAVPGYRVYRVPPQNIYHYIYCTDDSFFLQYFSSFFVFFFFLAFLVSYQMGNRIC